MSETEKGSAINIADNPKEWVDKHLNKAEEAPAPEPVQVNPLELKLPKDFEHGFFRDKPVSELYKSYRESESAKQRAERERNEEREMNRRLQAELAAVRATPPQPVKPAQIPDEYAEFNEIWFSEPEQVIKKLEAKHAEKAQKIAQEAINAYQAQKDQEYATKEFYARGQAAWEGAFNELASKTGITRATWEKRAPGILFELTNPQGAYYGNGGPTVAKNYVDAYMDIFGDSGAPAEPKAAVPQPAHTANPPGSKRSPVTASAPASGLPTLSADKKHLYEMMAGALGGGITADGLHKKHMQNMGKGK